MAGPCSARRVDVIKGTLKEGAPVGVLFVVLSLIFTDFPLFVSTAAVFGIAVLVEVLPC